ncbi:MAG: hypothetical protein AAF798_08650 [Bacteroidota bacterium]
MTFEQLEEFEKDLKSLKKKYRSLDEDLEVVKKILAVFPDQRPPFSFRIDNLGIATCVIKIKKIACKALKGRGVNSGLRLIYAYFEEVIEVKEHDEIIQPYQAAKIIMVELYHKKDKSTENRERIRRYFR